MNSIPRNNGIALPNQISQTQKVSKKKSFLCDICQKAFSVKDSLNVHNLSIHRKKFKFICAEPNCNKKYFNKYKLDCHRLTHTGEKPFSCSVCNKAFTTKGNLTSHSKLHNKDLERYSCDYCNRQYASKGNLNNHCRIVHFNEKKFKCKICSKRFGRSFSLKTHIIIHSGDKPFACPVEGCSKRYSAKGNLVSHIKVKHHYYLTSEHLKSKIRKIDSTTCVSIEQTETKGTDSKEISKAESQFWNGDFVHQQKKLKSEKDSQFESNEIENSVNDDDNIEDDYYEYFNGNSRNLPFQFINGLNWFLSVGEDNVDE